MRKEPGLSSFLKRSTAGVSAFLETTFARGAWKEYRLAFLISTLAFLAFSAALAYFLVRYTAQQSDQERTDLRQQTVQYQRALELSLAQQTNQHKSLSAYVQAELNSNGYVDPEEFEIFAAHLLENASLIRYISIAPAGVNRLIFPLAGNEPALGLDLIRGTTDEIQADMQRAIDLGITTMIGPYPLGEGKRGLLITQSVDFQNKFWGLTGVMVDLDQLLSQVGLMGSRQYQVLALRDEKQNFIFGAETVFDSNPEIFPIVVADKTWELAAVPSRGWGSYYRADVLFIGFGFGVSILFITIIIFLITSRTAYLQKAVSARTEELVAANQSLQMISECNEALVRAGSEAELLEQICSAIIRVGGFCRVWVGYLEGSALRRAASAGQCTSDLDQIEVIGSFESSASALADFETLRSGRSVHIQGIQQHPLFSDWVAAINHCGCTSALMLPLMDGTLFFGALIVSCETPEKLIADQTLLEQLANDLAFGLTSVRTRLEREEAKRSIERQNTLLTRVMDTSPAAILMLDTRGQLVFANSAAGQLIGSSIADFSHRNVTAFDWQIIDSDGQPVPPDQIPFMQVMQDRKPIYNVPLGARDLDGRLRWILLNVAPVLTGDAVEGVIMNITEITELRDAQIELVRSEGRYRQLFESVQEGIWVLDTNGQTSFVNEQMARILGRTSQELIGRALCEFIDDENKCISDEALAACRQGQAFQAETIFLHSAGRRVSANLQFTPIRNDQGQFTGSLVLATDTTTRRQREQELYAIARMAKALRGQSTRAEIIPAILEQMMGLVNGRGGLLAVMDEENDRIFFESAIGSWQAVQGMHLNPKAGVSYRIFREGTPYMTENILLDQELASPDLIAGLIAQFCVPLLVQGKVIGCVWVGRRVSSQPDEQPPSEDELKLLLAAGDIAASALYRATLNDETELRIRRLTALRDINFSFTTSLDAKPALDVLLDQLTRQFDLPAACVLRMEESQQMLFFAAGRGFQSLPSQSRPIHLMRDLAGQAVRTGQYLRLGLSPLVNGAFDRDWLGDFSNFQTYEAVPLTARGQIKGVLELFHNQPPPSDTEWFDFLRMLATQMAIALENSDLVERLQFSNLNLTLAYDATIEGWSQALELRDQETEGHSQRVVDLVLRLAAEMGIRQSDFVHVRRGALLHDIGKMAIPDRILFKTEELSPEEWAVMRKHPEYAFQLLAPISYLQPALDIPHYHHEHWDGSGYPLGLKGKDIPLAARIFAVVDVWDALSSDRPYSPAWPQAKTRDYLRQNAGLLFDPEIVEVFLTRIIPET